jgi:hypothetical protein
MNEQSSEAKEGIALSYSTANASAVVADIKTRKRTSVSRQTDFHSIVLLDSLSCAVINV